MVVLTRGYRTWHEAQQARRWDVVETPPPVLYGKRLGIVGYGAVGRHLAGICKAMGMEVWATRRRPLLPAGEPVDRVLAPGELPELLAASDVVVISPSLNGSTRALIGESELRLLRPSAILINVARGVMLDEEALAHALREERLAAAMLDVTQVEPLPAESSLWGTPNLLVTPHVAGNTRETWDWAMDLFYANLELFLAGEADRMANIVDYDAVR
jgi:phosphoglycerate dehydrogenase-like enzyme